MRRSRSWGIRTVFETVITSTLDMIQEFKMYTTGMPAEFGHSSGGQLSGVFKSGTNEFHGSLEDRYLNGALVHRQYFDQLKRCQDALNTAIPSPTMKWEERSVDPVIIPKLYNGKDRTFFSAVSSGTTRRFQRPSSGKCQARQCTPETSLLAGVGFPIYDPATIWQENGVWTADQFPGNFIPREPI